MNNTIELEKIAFGVGRISPENAEEAAINAIEVGFRMFDSSNSYGNQPEFGKGIQNCIANGKVKREELILTQKIASYQLGYNNTFKVFNESLENFGTDYIDILLAYLPSSYDPNWKRYVIDTWRAMEKLYKEGKAKIIGVSNFNVDQLGHLLHYAEIKPMINQIELHPSFQQRALVKFCQENNIKIEAWSPLMYDINSNLLKELDINGFQLTNEEIEYFNTLDGGMHSIDNQMIPPLDGNAVVQKLKFESFYRPQTYKRTYKLFGIIPFLTKTLYHWNKTVWRLFGIPILKIKTIEYTKK